jgi:tetratricopeptide (TPR) repeat protein
MTRIAPESAVAFNGLAEVYMQSGDFPKALDAARRANQLEPENWVTFYNLGMIEDRLKLPTNTIEHLERALALKAREKRHRALIHFYLARAYARLGDLDGARTQVDMLRKQTACWIKV